MRILGSELGGLGVEVAGDRLVQRILLPDLAHRAADAIDIGGGGLLVVPAHPVQEIGLGIEAFAAGEDLPKPGVRPTTEIRQEHIGGRRRYRRKTRG